MFLVCLERYQHVGGSPVGFSVTTESGCSHFSIITFMNGFNDGNWPVSASECLVLHKDKISRGQSVSWSVPFAPL